MKSALQGSREAFILIWLSGHISKDAPKDVVVYDISDQTASAKLTAVWGIDYLHLAKYDGKWKIINVLWQTPPKPTK